MCFVPLLRANLVNIFFNVLLYLQESASSAENGNCRGKMELIVSLDKNAPLAEQVRPKNLNTFVGQDKVVGQNSILRSLLREGDVTSMILWGPPGCGKVTEFYMFFFNSLSLYFVFVLDNFGKHYQPVLSSWEDFCTVCENVRRGFWRQRRQRGGQSGQK